MTWETLAALSPAEILATGTSSRTKRCLTPPKAAAWAARVFPRCRSKCFRRLERYDVEFDLPEAFLPEFPPAMFLQNRPEFGDVSRGEVVSINNYYRLFKDISTAVQLDGLRLLVTPFPQESSTQPMIERLRSPKLSGVTCFDCHVNGHTTGQFHITPDIRPEQRRIRLDTVSLRGLFNRKIHGSKRSLRAVEDFTEFGSAPLTSMAMRFTPSRKA